MDVKKKLVEIIVHTPRAAVSSKTAAEHIVDNLIDSGLTIQQWIPVADRLPTIEDTDKTGSVFAILRVEGYAKSWSLGIVTKFPTEFTYWMPMPKPPRETSYE